VVKNREKFLGSKHWGIEVISAISNLILRNPDTKTVAKKISFEYNNQKLKIDTGKALDPNKVKKLEDERGRLLAKKRDAQKELRNIIQLVEMKQKNRHEKLMIKFLTISPKWV
jgi:hypothetical protein